MSAFRGELPGFYFDTDKNRYFRIQQNHRRPLDGTGYTRETVQAKKRDAKVQADQQRDENRARRGQIRRAQSANPSLTTRLGDKQDIESLLRRQYAGGLTGRAASVVRERGLAQLAHPQKLLNAVTCHSGKVYTITTQAFGHRTVYTIQLVNEISQPLSFASGVMTGSIQQRIGMAPLGDSHMAYFAGRTFGVRSVVPPWDTHQEYRDFAESIWDVATATDAVALASNNGLDVFSLCGWAHMSPATHYTRKEQRVVAFQHDSRIVMSGQRNGKVVFTDTRVGGGHVVDASVQRLLHLKQGSGINGIAPTRRPHQVIVSALRGASLYDLRFTGPGRSNKNRQAPSKPLVEFAKPGDCSHTTYGWGKQLAYMASLDLAVISSFCPSANLNAGFSQSQYQPQAGSQDSKIALYEVATGRVLPMPRLQLPLLNEINDVVVGRVRDGPESILIGSAGHLYELNVDFTHDEERIGQHELTMSGGVYSPKVPVIGEHCFPPASEPGVVALWEKGDRGPS